MGARPRIRKPKSTLAARARGGVSRTSTARCLCRAPSGAAIRRRTRPGRVRTRSDFSPAHARSPLPLRAAVLLCGCADEHFRASGERKGRHSGATDRPFAAAGSQPQGMRAGCVLAAPILGILHFARRGIALHTPSLLSHLFALFRSSRRRTGWWLTGDYKLSVYLGADGCLLALCFPVSNSAQRSARRPIARLLMRAYRPHHTSPKQNAIANTYHYLYSGGRSHHLAAHSLARTQPLARHELLAIIMHKSRPPSLITR